jgi:hypothetical protein
MNTTWPLTPMTEAPHDYDEPSLVSVDRRQLSDDVAQEIVLLAGAAWVLWLSQEGDIVAAHKGPLA